MKIDLSVHEYLKRIGFKPGEFLKVTVKGGGCSGLQYSFEKQEGALNNDVFCDTWVLTDNRSFLFLKDCTLLYKEQLGGSILVVENPVVKATCGCGASFSV